MSALARFVEASAFVSSPLSGFWLQGALLDEESGCRRQIGCDAWRREKPSRPSARKEQPTMLLTVPSLPMAGSMRGKTRPTFTRWAKTDTGHYRAGSARRFTSS